MLRKIPLHFPKRFANVWSKANPTPSPTPLTEAQLQDYVSVSTRNKIPSKLTKYSS
jgi:hypothetical protein